jgi:hypothetical protein
VRAWITLGKMFGLDVQSKVINLHQTIVDVLTIFTATPIK